MCNLLLKSCEGPCTVDVGAGVLNDVVDVAVGPVQVPCVDAIVLG